MSSTQSPNMMLIIPGVGTQPGPTWASNLNTSLTLIDQHDHTNGKGVQITPQGLNINADLDFNDNFAVSISGVTLSAQSSTPNINTIYESGIDLYYVDGLGNNIRITQSGGIAGSPGSIAGLVAPASATYVSGSSTFVWQSNTSIAANMDAGSILMRNLSPDSTFALTLQPPAALSANYSITLPTIPTSQKIMTMDNSGVQAAVYTVDNSSIEIAANVIQIKDNGVTTAKILDSNVTTNKINNLAVTNAKIADATIDIAKMAAIATTTGATSGTSTSTSSSFVTIASVTQTVVANRPVMIYLNGTAAAGSGRIGANTNGTSFGKFRIRDNTNGITITSFSFDTSIGASILYYPASALNGTYSPTIAGSTQYVLQYSTTTGGSTVAVDAVSMTVVQV
jgi:hypothetical protein